MKIKMEKKFKGKKTLGKIKVAQWNHAECWRLSPHRLFNWRCILRVRLEEEEKKDSVQPDLHENEKKGKVGY